MLNVKFQMPKPGHLTKAFNIFDFSFSTRKAGGGNRIRTDDILLAKQALYQLSYTPVAFPRAGSRLAGSLPKRALRSGLSSMKKTGEVED